ncbi:MAG: hypothetical protein GXX94_04625 [Chloroflexi bacterium]|nr:hypothetical protein [Chloroflexota bacterium]
MLISRVGRGAESAGTPRIERVSVYGGALQLDPTTACAVPAPSRRAAESRGSLYVLLTAASGAPLPAALSAEIVSAMGETYYELSGSITRGLRAALLAANGRLFDHNVRSDPAMRLTAGGICVVVRLDDLYIAQMGPAAVLVGRGMDALRFPDRSVWISHDAPVGADLDREPPLGLRKDAEPSLFHAAYRPEDLVLLVSAGLLREASDGEVVAASLRTDRDDLAQSLTDLSNGRDLDLLVIRPARQIPAEESQSPIVSTPSERAGALTAEAPDFPEIETLPGVSGGAARDLPLRPFDRPQASQDEPESTERLAFELDAESELADDEEDLVPVSEASLADADDLETEESDLAYADMAYADVGHAESGSADRVQRAASSAPVLRDVDLDDDSELLDETWDDDVEGIRTPGPGMGRISEALAQGARKLRDGTEDVLLSVLPKEVPPRPPDVARPGISLGARALVAVAMIIPLIVLFTVVMTRIQYDRARAAQYVNAVEQAQYLYDQAVRQEDLQLKRDGLYRALDVVDQGLALTPDNVDLLDLRRRAQHQVDQVEGVQVIYNFARLYYFEDTPASATDSSRVVVHGKDVMVLNRGSDRIYRFYLNDVGDALQPTEANPVVLRSGDVIDGVTITDLVDLGYMASEGSQTLARFIALDRGGSLLSYDATRGMRVQPVANADLWLSPQAIGSYFGNLYVLDPLLGRLFKYLPSNNEYVKTPLDYFDAALGVDLTGSVDLAIDSNVYVLYADGTVKKYNNGIEVEFGMRGFYGTMRSPVAIFVSGEQQADAPGYVYVADAGNQRVLQFTKDGDFVRQFRAVESEPFMDNLRGIYVDETERRMFLVSGQHFVMCTLPPVQ